MSTPFGINKIMLDVLPGAFFATVIVEAKRIANLTGYAVMFKFNGDDYLLNPGDSGVSSKVKENDADPHSKTILGSGPSVF